MPPEEYQRKRNFDRTPEPVIAGARNAVWTKEIAPSLLPGAKEAPQPQRFAPQLAVPADSPPDGDQWLHEIKYDGYRVLTFLKARNARLLTRNGKDWTAKFRGIAEAAERLPVKEGVFDGEVVVLRPDGTTDFQALQNVLQGIETGTLAYYLFDLPSLDGYDLTATPLIERKTLLERLLRSLGEGSPIRYSDHIRGRGQDVYKNACELALEGIVSKRIDSRYVQRRSRSWLKVKCLNRQEFVVGGYSEPSGGRKGFGALLVGAFDQDGRLIYCGRVGTGFNEQSLALLYERLTKAERATAPFENPPAGREARGVHWVSPELVAEIAFSSWTNEGVLRQPSFKGLREDKAPREVSIERPTAVGARFPKPHGPDERRAAKAPKSGMRTKFAGVSLTNPDRILYPEDGITKRDLAAYYEGVADWILPHVTKRPLMLLRCPEGLNRDCFFQKHLDEALPKTLRGVAIQEKENEEVYIVLDDLPGLISLVQMSVLEIHPWQSREDKVEKPDRIIFDLDPGPDTPWKTVVGCAEALRDRLLDLDLRSFLKTSGGKGLHVVVPLIRRSGWEEIKAFARAVAEETARQAPKRFVSTVAKRKRKGKVFIDYVRNSRGATTVAPYSTRARAGAPISTPLHWDELSSRLSSNQCSLKGLPVRLKTLGGDPWGSFFSVRQSLTKKMKDEVGLR